MNEKEREKEKWKKNWKKYLERLHMEPLSLTTEYATKVREFWRDLVNTIPNIQLPIAGVTTENTFQFAWSSITFYLHIDIHEDGMFEWFWSDRVSDEYEGTEDSVHKLPEKLIEVLKQKVVN